MSRQTRRPNDGHPLQQGVDLFRLLDDAIEVARDPNPTLEDPHRLPLGWLKAKRADLFNACCLAIQADPTLYQRFRRATSEIQAEVDRRLRREAQIAREACLQFPATQEEQRKRRDVA